jgi:hypothetical protein
VIHKTLAKAAAVIFVAGGDGADNNAYRSGQQGTLEQHMRIYYL